MAIRPLLNDHELLAKLAEGDQYAFKIIYERFNFRIYSVCIKMLQSTVIAEEITQEVFLKLWKQEQPLKDINHLEAWLRTTARRLSLNAFRKLIAEKKTDQEATSNFKGWHNDTEEAILLRDARDVLHVAIAQLPEKQREAYMLCQQEGMSYEEAAAQLNVSVNTVKTHMKRAMAAVRKHMKGNIDIAAILVLLKLF